MLRKGEKQFGRAVSSTISRASVCLTTGLVNISPLNSQFRSHWIYPLGGYWETSKSDCRRISAVSNPTLTFVAQPSRLDYPRAQPALSCNHSTRKRSLIHRKRRKPRTWPRMLASPVRTAIPSWLPLVVEARQHGRDPCFQTYRLGQTWDVPSHCLTRPVLQLSLNDPMLCVSY